LIEFDRGNLTLRSGEVRARMGENGAGTLRMNVTSEEIAQALLHFASKARSGKSAGNLLSVDGGVPAAHAP
jgi:ABC-type hemin transport system ATPase subunit